MDLSDDLHQLWMRATHANARTATAHAHTPRGTSDAGRARIIDWQADVQWDEGVRDGHAGEHSSRNRQRSPARREATGQWGLWLLAGVAWIVIALSTLQFEGASVTTARILVALMFALAAVENFALVKMPGGVRWVPAVFGALFVSAEILCFVIPAASFSALADMLGFVFGLIGVWWMVEAFVERPLNPLWWMGLIAGIVTTGLAFGAAGQLSMHKPYELLVCVGFWALMQGITHIARAFAIRRLQDELEGRGAAVAAAPLPAGPSRSIAMSIYDATSVVT
jgi:uncharacterized membrane protein HdeD (DUF308 family)